MHTHTHTYTHTRTPGIPDPAGVSWTGHAVTGDTIPVFPGEKVRTNFTMLTNGTWLLQYSVLLTPEEEEKQQPGRGNLQSVVQVDHPYMNPKLSWLHDDFNHTLVGACNEVYNLDPRPTDVPRSVHQQKYTPTPPAFSRTRGFGTPDPTFMCADSGALFIDDGTALPLLGL